MISAVICTANPRPDYLRRTVESLLAQTYDPALWELLIIDNASAAPVAQALIVVENGVRVIHESRIGLTAAKQRAAKEVAGEVVVFVDDDNVLDPNYLSIVADVFSDPRVGVLGPEIRAEYEVAPPAWFHDPRLEASLVIRSLPNERTYLSSVPDTGSYFPSGAGSCVRTSILAAYFGSLTEATRIEGRQGTTLSGGEDWDIGLFAIADGYFVGTCGRLRLTHLIPTSRTDPMYLRRLVVGSLDGAAQVNDKWRGLFGHDVVPYFRGSAVVETLKGLIHLSMSRSPRHRILAAFHLHLARLLSRRRTVGSDLPAGQTGGEPSSARRPPSADPI